MSRPAVYTIVNRASISSAFANGERGELLERRRWASAHATWQACKDSETSYVLLLGDAAVTRGVEWVALIESIDLFEDGRSLVTFSGLRSLKTRLPLRRLLKASDGIALSDEYIRPYVPCQLNGATLRTVQHALASSPMEVPVANARQLQGWRESEPDQTERDVLAAARIGQGAYRSAMLRLWQGQCAVTACSVLEVLVASHAKPWRDSSNKERLDPYNGLLLAAHLDKLFDAGLISFDETGQMLRKPSLGKDDLLSLGLDVGSRLSRVDERHLPYLAAHRAANGFP